MTGVSSSWAVSHTALSSSGFQANSSPLWRGIDPVAWILIQSAPYLMWRRVIWIISSTVPTTWA